ncbi:MAG TPA: cupin-like domain-containing protein [Kofleriaceae bacterium]
MIATLASPPTSADFYRDHWAPREPLIVTGDPSSLVARHDHWRTETILERMRADGAAVHNLIWFDTPEGVLADRTDLPAFVADHIYGAAHVTRGRHYRLFLHDRGHITGLHYEGNLLDVYSFQLRGTRRWKLLRGDRAHKLLPFYFVENQLSYAPVGDEPAWTYVVDLQPGDLLFLPRGWYHHVESLSDDNIALSLVSAPRDPGALACHTLSTYREQLALQYHLRAVLPQRFRHKVARFISDDAAGLDWTRHFIADVPYAARLRRLATDLAFVTPRMLATMAFDRRTRDYIAYLEALGASLERKLRSST